MWVRLRAQAQLLQNAKTCQAFETQHQQNVCQPCVPCREAFAAWLPPFGVPLSYAIAISYVLVDTFDKGQRAFTSAERELGSRASLHPEVNTNRYSTCAFYQMLTMAVRQAKVKSLEQITFPFSQKYTSLHGLYSESYDVSAAPTDCVVVAT